MVGGARGYTKPHHHPHDHGHLHLWENHPMWKNQCRQCHDRLMRWLHQDPPSSCQIDGLQALMFLRMQHSTTRNLGFSLAAWNFQNMWPSTTPGQQDLTKQPYIASRHANFFSENSGMWLYFLSIRTQSIALEWCQQSSSLVLYMKQVPILNMLYILCDFSVMLTLNTINYGDKYIFYSHKNKNTTCWTRSSFSLFLTKTKLQHDELDLDLNNYKSTKNSKKNPKRAMRAHIPTCDNLYI